MLIFSQFVTMLHIIKRAMDEDGVAYEYLDGSTKDRQQKVDNFQREDGPPLFLISLKAGGSGLNLTAADTVIHYDPWWNPAVAVTRRPTAPIAIGRDEGWLRPTA